MYDHNNLVDRLAQVSHLRNLPRSALERIIRSGRLLAVAEGSVIFVEGEPCAGLFVLLAGRVNLSMISPQGQEAILAVVQPVIMFNEVPTLDGGPNVVTARAAQASRVWHASPQEFGAILHEHPAAALGLLRVLAHRNRFLVSQSENLSFRSVVGRTAKLLKEAAPDHSQAR